MSTHRIDGPNGPEDVHLLQEDDREVAPHVLEARKADRGWFKWPAIIAVVVLGIVIIGLIQEGTLVAGLVALGVAVLILAACAGRGRN